MKSRFFFVYGIEERDLYGMKSRISLILGIAFMPIVSWAASTETAPLDVAKRIGDRLVETTPFRNRMVIDKTDHKFDKLRLLDISRTFGQGNNETVFAFTTISVEKDTLLPVQFDFSGNCELSVNGKIVFQDNNDRPLSLQYDERNIDLRERLHLPLNAGSNSLVVKLMGGNQGWKFALQPEPDKMRVGASSAVTIGLLEVDGIDRSVSDISEWLLCGPFGVDSIPVDVGLGLWDKVYEGRHGKKVSWTIPHIDISADVIDPAPWGTPYNWNYHNGGTAWAMQCLAEISGEEKYAEYCDNFCNFHLANRPLIEYEVEDLGQFECTNHHIYRTPLLDFTLAPSLPYIYKLAQGTAENGEWNEWVNEMLEYSQSQIRLPGRKAYTRTSPETYTTWVDDMFMGIPFLVQAYQYTGDKKYLDDAISQIEDFNEVVWDKEADLYMHAQYSTRDVKLPHWSRANGWGLWAVTEVLSSLPDKDKRKKKLLAHYKKHIDSLLKYQTENGLWYNVPEYPESREEVSGTAIFTLAMARGIRNGWLPEKKYREAVEKAWEGLQTKIDPDGSVRDICYGTMCSEDVNYYIGRPFYTNDTHGLFAVLFACLELHQLLNGE